MPNIIKFGGNAKISIVVHQSVEKGTKNSELLKANKICCFGLMQGYGMGNSYTWLQGSNDAVNFTNVERILSCESSSQSGNRFSLLGQTEFTGYMYWRLHSEMQQSNPRLTVSIYKI